MLANSERYYLTRHIYVRHNTGDLNDLGTKIWEFFRKPPHNVFQIKSIFSISLLYKKETQYLRKLIAKIFSDKLFHLVNNFYGAFGS